jgi:hypothetical protein
MKLNLFKLFLLSLLIACQSDGQNTGVLKKVKSISIPLSTERPISDHSYSLNCDIDENKLYYIVNDKSTVLKIDLDKQRIEETFKYSESQGLSRLEGVQPLKDNLVLTNLSTPTLFMADKKTGSIEGKINYDVNVNNYLPSYSYLYSRFNVNFIESDNAIYIYQYLWSRGGAITQNQIDTHPILIKYNKKDSSFSKLPYKYPKLYLENNLAPESSYFSITGEEDMAFISFCYYPKIYKIDLMELKLEEFTPESKYIDEPFPSNREGPIEHLIRSPRFSHIHYDKKNDLVYLVVKHAGDPQKEIDFEDLQYGNNFSVVVFGGDMSFKGEFLIDSEQKYVMDNMFVGPEGLYISRNNPYHVDYDENSLDFDIFSLQ